MTSRSKTLLTARLREVGMVNDYCGRRPARNGQIFTSPGSIFSPSLVRLPAQYHFGSTRSREIFSLAHHDRTARPISTSIARELFVGFRKSASVKTHLLRIDNDHRGFPYKPFETRYTVVRRAKVST